MRGRFTSPKEVRQTIDAFVTVYSENARSFEWRKAEVRQTTPQQKYADMTIPFHPVARSASGSTSGEKAETARRTRRTRRQPHSH